MSAARIDNSGRLPTGELRTSAFVPARRDYGGLRRTFAPAFALRASAGKLRTPHFFAFTLIELLVVIGIIVLLAGILIPAVSTAMRSAEDARARARMQELANGCEGYYKDYNCYPGQDNIGALAGGAGSRVLATRLFAKPVLPGQLLNMNDPNHFPVSQYAPVKYDRDDPASPANNDLLVLSGEPNSVSDRCSEPMAILYYPARVGVSGLSQFDVNDNSAYVTGTADGGWQNAESPGFSNYIKDRRFEGTASATPYGKGSFIMITAGIDRQYGTLDDGHYPHW